MYRSLLKDFAASDRRDGGQIRFETHKHTRTNTHAHPHPPAHTQYIITCYYNNAYILSLTSHTHTLIIYVYTLVHHHVTPFTRLHTRHTAVLTWLNNICTRTYIRIISCKCVSINNHHEYSKRKQICLPFFRHHYCYFHRIAFRWHWAPP